MSESRTVKLTRLFDAPIELVYRAWTEAEHVCKWMKCEPTVTCEVDNWIPAVGTRFETHMFKEGTFDVRGHGEFTEVDPPNVLAYRTDADPSIGAPEMSVRVVLAEKDGKTELTLTHSGIPNDMMCGVIEGGWTNSLGMLQDVAMTLVGLYVGTRIANTQHEAADGETESAS